MLLECLLQSGNKMWSKELWKTVFTVARSEYENLAESSAKMGYSELWVIQGLQRQLDQLRYRNLVDLQIFLNYSEGIIEAEVVTEFDFR